MVKPNCRLIGKNGNVFNIIGIVAHTLKENDQGEKAKEFINRATAAHSYEDVLAMLREYINVK